MRYVLSLLVGIGAQLFVASAHACDSDTDCKGDRTCVAGKCEDAIKTCAKDRECPGEELCRAGRCSPPTAPLQPAAGTPPPAPPAAVPVDKVRVRVAGLEGRTVTFATGTQGEVCTMPCTVRLVPGPQQVSVSDMSKTFTVVIPTMPSTVEVHARKSAGLPVTMMILGGLAVGVGATMLAEGLSRDDSDGHSLVATGAGVLIPSSIVFLIASIAVGTLGKDAVEVVPGSNDASVTHSRWLVGGSSAGAGPKGIGFRF
jgi:hypothetical protein